MNIIKWLTSRQYRVFYKKTKDHQVAIWELEFKIAKSRQLREGVRQDRDRAVESVNRLKAVIEQEKDKAVKAQLEEQSKAHQENADRFEKQMALIDGQINGTTDESGILERLKSVVELRNMTFDYMSKL